MAITNCMMQTVDRNKLFQIYGAAYHVPVVKSPCPADGHTKREYVKNLLRQINRDNPGVKERMFTAIQNGNMKGWSEYIGCNEAK